METLLTFTNKLEALIVEAWVLYLETSPGPIQNQWLETYHALSDERDRLKALLDGKETV